MKTNRVLTGFLYSIELATDIKRAIAGESVYVLADDVEAAIRKLKVAMGPRTILKAIEARSYSSYGGPMHKDKLIV